MAKKKAGKKKAAKTKPASRKKLVRGKKAVSRAKRTPSKIPGGGVSAEIHQGVGPAPANPSEIAPKVPGDASN